MGIEKDEDVAIGALQVAPAKNAWFTHAASISFLTMGTELQQTF